MSPWLEVLMEREGEIPALDEVLNKVIRRYAQDLLTQTNGNVADAALLAGRHRTAFYNLLTVHGIDRHEFEHK